MTIYDADLPGFTLQFHHLLLLMDYLRPKIASKSIRPALLRIDV